MHRQDNKINISATQSSRITYTSSNSAIASVSDAGLNTIDAASTTYVRVDINPSKTYHVKVRAFRYNDTDDNTSQVKEYGQYSKSVKIKTDKK